MDKITFLRELEQGLSVLQRDELEDIISEYEQHIDMKIKNGLPEEEAIADFGGLEELTAEILTVYHVRADYAERNVEENRTTFRKRLKWREIWSRGSGWMKHSGSQAVRIFCELGHVLWQMFAFWGRQISRPFRWAGDQWDGYRNGWGYREGGKNMEEDRIVSYTGQENVEEDNIAVSGGYGTMGEDSDAPSKTSKEIEKMLPHSQGRAGRGKAASQIAVRQGGFLPSFFRKIRKAAKTVFQVCKKAVCWSAGILWNAFWLVNICICLLLGLFSLFVLGLLMVLIVQNYPISGVLIGCVGMTMCLFSLACLGVTFMWRPGMACSRPGNEG